MDQFVLLHFAVRKNERLYLFQVQPNSPWEEVYEALDEFKKEFSVLQEQAVKHAQERESKKEEDSSPEVVAEVVS